MSTIPDPVDSTTRPCCGGIGTHTPECLDAVPLPPGATGTDWEPGSRWFDDESRDVRMIHGHQRHVGRAAVVYAQAFQLSDGTIICDDEDGPSVVVEGLNGEGQGLARGQARAVALAISAVADENDRWAGR